MNFADLRKYLVNAVFPPQCLMCGKIIATQGKLCPECFSSLVFVSAPFCEVCGRPLDAISQKWEICPYCSSNKRVFTKARFALVYDEASKNLILPFKHADKTLGTKLLAQFMVNAGKDILAEADVVVPVPLFWLRLLKRRYNQAALLAREIAALTGKQSFCNSLKRKKNTKSQGLFSARGRKSNIKGAFMVPPKDMVKFKNKTVVLVDDVFTTGATVEECARVLKRAGAAKVHVLTLAAVFKS